MNSLPSHILVADDEQEILVSCRKILQRAGHDVVTASDGSEAINQLKARPHDLLLVDLKMPGVNGMETLTLAKALDPALMVIMFTAFTTLETAVEAVKRGAFDYLAKPFTAEQLMLAVDRALSHRRLLEENANLREQIGAHLGFDKIIGKSEAMTKLFAKLQRVIQSDANILLQGDTGTGKELVARTIHAHSLRRENPFVAVDCAALPEHLLESEVFGHEKGAYTGADKTSRGLLELAHTGTLFLDEVGELSIILQAKFLRSLQERELRRLGSEKTVPVDIRVIAATSRDLRAEVATKNFREELYYRLNVVGVQLPSLRDRREDIPLLASHFLESFGRQYSRHATSFSPEVIQLFFTYHWPGNVRELQNVIQHAVLVSDGDTVCLTDLPEYLQAILPEKPSFQSLREKQSEAAEKSFLIELLRKHHGNVSDAATEAKMTRKMIYRLTEKFGIAIEEFRAS